MDGNADETVSVTSSQNDEIGTMGRRIFGKNINSRYLLGVICSSRESCLNWLKNRGLIPKVLFCPKCKKKMKSQADDQAVDGYVWICKECKTDPPQFSSRHGSWLESRDAPLVNILYFTYLWVRGYPEELLSRELNMQQSSVDEWMLVYSTICDSLYQRNMQGDDDLVDGNILDPNNETSADSWRRKNANNDLFLEFLKDADSL